MPDKSGEGAVILTRSQKFFQSSPDPDSLTFFSTCAPRGAAPNHQKASAFHSALAKTMN